MNENEQGTLSVHSHWSRSWQWDRLKNFVYLVKTQMCIASVTPQREGKVRNRGSA